MNDFFSWCLTSVIAYTHMWPDHKVGQWYGLGHECICKISNAFCCTLLFKLSYFHYVYIKHICKLCELWCLLIMAVKGILSEIIAGSNFVIWMITASLQYLQVSACYIIVNAHVYFCMEICLQLILLFLCRRRVDTKAKYACYTSSRSFSSWYPSLQKESLVVTWISHSICDCICNCCL